MSKVGLALRIGGRILRKKNRPIEKEKEEINKILRQLALPFVIFIDDIDRLDNKEILSLFKLLKLTADFDNIRYVLAFDPDFVSGAIGKDFGFGGKAEGMEFLEKIIQFPIRLPEIGKRQLLEFTLKRFNIWIDEENIDLPSREDLFIHNFRKLHYRFLAKPRDSVRLFNSRLYYDKVSKGQKSGAEVLG